MTMSDAGAEPYSGHPAAPDKQLEAPKHTVFGTGLDADKVHQMNDDEEHTKHAADHNQPPRNLMGSLIFLANGPQLRLRKNAERDQAGGKTEAYDPVE